VANHDQRHTLSRRERQGCFRLEQTFFVTGFNNSHDLHHTRDGDLVASRGKLAYLNHPTTVIPIKISDSTLTTIAIPQASAL
jgi:hypothetical protein